MRKTAITESGKWVIHLTPKQAEAMMNFSTEKIDVELLKAMPKGITFETINEITKYETQLIGSDTDAIEQMRFLAHMLTTIIETDNGKPALLAPIIKNLYIIKQYLKADYSNEINWLINYYNTSINYIDAQIHRNRVKAITKRKGNF